MLADPLPAPEGIPAPAVLPSVLVEVRVVVAAICDILAASEDSPSMGVEMGSGNVCGNELSQCCKGAFFSFL
jgi:hypothetical protein